MANMLDKMVGYFSPNRALRRKAARMKMRAIDEFEKRDAMAFKGASGGRRLGNWKTTSASADAASRSGRTRLRDRANDLVRNNPHAANGVAKLADNLVGDGIEPKFVTGDDKLDAVLKEKWEEFVEECDPEGQINFYGKQHQAVRIMIQTGEVFLRRRIRKASDGYKVGLQIQTLEPDIIDEARSQPYAPRSQNRVSDGIEYDAVGRRRGYWMFAETDAVPLVRPQSSFVVAEDVAHLYEPARRQSRGTTWLAPVMTRIKDLDDYDSAERLRKKVEACMVGIIEDDENASELDDPEAFGLPERRDAPPAFDENDPERPEPTEPDPWPIEDLEGDPVERMEPGAFYRAKYGTKVSFNTPSSSAGYDTYNRAAIKAIAAGLRMPYEVLSGDLSEVSYASGRMGTVEFRRFLSGMQWNYIIPMLCSPVARWFLTAMILQGVLKEGVKVKVDWAVPSFQSISPIDDVRADLLEVRSGFMSWDEAVRKRGRDPDLVAAEMVKRTEYWDQHKITLDVDPRAVSQSGVRHRDNSTSGGSGNATGEQDREEAGFTGRPFAGGPLTRQAGVEG